MIKPIIKHKEEDGAIPSLHNFVTKPTIMLKKHAKHKDQFDAS